MSEGLTYLASLYSHPDAAVREARFREACRCAAALMRQGYLVFSPIAHSHPMVEFGLAGDYRFWEEFDGLMMAACSRMIVLTLDGYQDSIGVQAEVKAMRALGRPVRFVDPETLA